MPSHVASHIVRRRLLAVYAIAVLLGFPLLAALYKLAPDLRPELTIEDRAVENIALAMTLAAAVAGTVQLLRPYRQPNVLWAIPLYAAFASIEELNWGERLFDIEMPVIAGVQVDSVQDIPEAALSAAADYFGTSATVLAVLVPAGVLAWVAWHRRAPLAERAGRLWSLLPMRFLLFSVAFGLIAILPDKAYDLSESMNMILLEETLELYAALALLFAAISLTQPDPGSLDR